jgi:hypothetical protein
VRRYVTSRERPCLDVVDKAPDAVLVRDERTRLDARNRLADVGVEVAEALGRPFGLDAGIVLDLLPEFVVAEREHAAVGVVDQHDFLRPEQPLRDRERADFVVGDDAARIADDVGVALAQPEQPVRVQARVHARHDGDPLCRR